MVCKDAMRRVVAVIKGPVGGILPQSSQAAEYLAATSIAPCMGEASQLFIDCMNVVRDFNRPAEEQVHHKRRYAGLMKKAQGHAGWVNAMEARWQNPT